MMDKIIASSGPLQTAYMRGSMQALAATAALPSLVLPTRSLVAFSTWSGMTSMRNS